MQVASKAALVLPGDCFGGGIQSVFWNSCDQFRVICQLAFYVSWMYDAFTSIVWDFLHLAYLLNKCVDGMYLLQFNNSAEILSISSILLAFRPLIATLISSRVSGSVLLDHY